MNKDPLGKALSKAHAALRKFNHHIVNAERMALAHNGSIRREVRRLGEVGELIHGLMCDAELTLREKDTWLVTVTNVLQQLRARQLSLVPDVTTQASA